MNRSAGSRRPPGLITVRFSGRSCPSPAASPPEMPATRQTQSVLENFRGGVLSRAVVADRNPPGIGFRLPAGTGSGPLHSPGSRQAYRSRRIGAPAWIVHQGISPGGDIFFFHPRDCPISMRAAGPLSPGDSRGHLPGESPPALSSVEAARWGVLLDPQTLPVDRGFSPAPLCARGFFYTRMPSARARRMKGFSSRTSSANSSSV